jgi:hypothetical protein
LFCIVDVIKVLIDPDNPQKYWKELKKNLGIQTIIINKYFPELLEGKEILELLEKIPNIDKSVILDFQSWLSFENFNRKYILQHQDIPVIELEINVNGIIINFGEVFNEEHLPVCCINDDSINFARLRQWWTNRSIPISRPYINELLEYIDLDYQYELLLNSYALSLTDHYWIVPFKEDLKWKDWNYFQNDFSSDVGDYLLSQRINHKTLLLNSPDNSTDGALSKQWVIIDNQRVLLKKGTLPYQQEINNERIAYIICRELGISCVEYSYHYSFKQLCSSCKCFVDYNTEFVSAWQLIDEFTNTDTVSNYEKLILKMEGLGVKDVRLRLEQMLVLDFLIGNTDRHYNNFGFIRDPITLKWLGFCPLFDNGTSLFATTPTNNINITETYIQCKPFQNFHIQQIRLVKDFSWLNLSLIKNVENIMFIGEMPYERLELIRQFIKVRINMLENIKEEINY